MIRLQPDEYFFAVFQGRERLDDTEEESKSSAHEYQERLP